MSVSITADITGQEISSTTSYCYLYEPLKVSVSETITSAKNVLVEMEVYHTATGVLFETKSSYGVYDLNPGKSISIDLMKLAQQYHNANLYKFSHIDEIVGTNGWKSVVSEYIYKFNITTEVSLTPVVVKKLPIIGVRPYKGFEPEVLATNKLDEITLGGLSFDNRSKGYPFINSTLSAIGGTDLSPSITKTISTSGNSGCGGQVIWKSKLGGWMTFGFNIKVEKQDSNYTGNIQVGMFEANNGNAFVPVNYTGIETSYSISLKQLSLNSEELRAVQDIEASPAVYYMKDNTGGLELMRRNSSSAPINSLANGGDFSVELGSISNSNQKTR